MESDALLRGCHGLNPGELFGAREVVGDLEKDISILFSLVAAGFDLVALVPAVPRSDVDHVGRSVFVGELDHRAELLLAPGDMPVFAPAIIFTVIKPGEDGWNEIDIELLNQFHVTLEVRLNVWERLLPGVGLIWSSISGPSSGCIEAIQKPPHMLVQPMFPVIYPLTFKVTNHVRGCAIEREFFADELEERRYITPFVQQFLLDPA